MTDQRTQIVEAIVGPKTVVYHGFKAGYFAKTKIDLGKTTSSKVVYREIKEAMSFLNHPDSDLPKFNVKLQCEDQVLAELSPNSCALVINCVKVVPNGEVKIHVCCIAEGDDTCESARDNVCGNACDNARVDTCDNACDDAVSQGSESD